ncbi:MAG: glycosyltransferase family 2 protein [Lachnospiraceae bacterium]|nr:glycosyltransferase family 2 protein [Lachnospiraceae bacterium]
MKHNESVSIGAVIIAFNPEMSRLQENINAIIAQVNEIIVVDNASDNLVEIERYIQNLENVFLIKMVSNCGIARALNEGVRYLQKKGYEWALTLDQDSVCPSDLIRGMLHHLENSRYGILCPKIQYEGWKSWKSDPKETLEEVKACMTSGSLTRVSAWKKVGGFSEEYFIDFVDNDFCEKLKIAGYKIIRVNSVVLKHQLGDAREKTILGVVIRYTYHNPWRYYYMTRNNLYFIKKYRERLNVPKEYLKVLYIIMKGLGFEKNKIEVLRYVKKGFQDALRDKMGELTVW